MRLVRANRDAYTWRPITRDDSTSWAALLASIEAVDQEYEHVGVDDLLDQFGDPCLDFPDGSRAAFDGGVMVAYGTLRGRTAADPAHEMVLTGGVHPAYRGRGRGLGSRLLHWAEQAALPLHAERFPNSPLTPGSLNNDRSSQCLVAAQPDGRTCPVQEAVEESAVRRHVVSTQLSACF